MITTKRKTLKMMNTDVNIWQCLILLCLGWLMSSVSMIIGLRLGSRKKKDDRALAEMEMLEEDDVHEQS